MRSNICPRLLVIAIAGGLASGCADQSGNNQLLGAGLGAAVGCGIGAAVAGQKGCAVGGALGAAAGWGLVAHYESTQVRSAQQDQSIYGVTEPVSTTQVKIRKGSASPNRVRPGGNIKIATDYSLMAPAGQATVPVEESWVLMKDGKALSNLPAQRNNRAPGGWVADASVKIPGNAKPGTYVVEHKVQSGSSYDTDESTFVVGG